MPTPISRRTILAAAVATPAVAALPALALPAAAATTVLSSNLETATVSNPASVADMRAFFGDSTGTGNAATFAHTAINNASRNGVPTKVLSQYLDAGTYGPAGNANNPTGTGIAVTNVNLNVATPLYECTIEYDFRLVGSGRWPYGGKLPGIGGSLDKSSPPTGGEPETTGFSTRLMHRRLAKSSTATYGKLVAYVYNPSLAAQGQGTTGIDYDLGVQLNWTQWYHAKQYVRMNSILVEKQSGRPDGIHRVEIDGVQVYENLNQIWRWNTDAKTRFYIHDIFLGGNDPDWAAPNDMRVDIDNLLITTP